MSNEICQTYTLNMVAAQFCKWNHNDPIKGNYHHKLYFVMETAYHIVSKYGLKFLVAYYSMGYDGHF